MATLQADPVLAGEAWLTSKEKYGNYCLCTGYTGETHDAHIARRMGAEDIKIRKGQSSIRYAFYHPADV